MRGRQVERRSCPAPASRAAGQGGGIAGLASVYYDGTPATEFELFRDGPDRAVERIMPGAFDAALKRKDDARALFNHDSNMILGRVSAGTLKLTSTSAGLAYQIDPPDTSVARDVMESIRRGDVTGSSFAFVPDAESWKHEKLAGGGVLYVREVRSLTLYDVGPVTYPAYKASTATVGRSSPTPTAPAPPRGGTSDAVMARLRVLQINGD